VQRGIKEGRAVRKQTNQTDRTKSVKREFRVIRNMRTTPKYKPYYSRSENQGKLFLKFGMTIEVLYRDHFIFWCKKETPISAGKYRRVLGTEFCIGFQMPKSDIWKYCDEFVTATEEAQASCDEIERLVVSKSQRSFA
jgi:hypothetical protein